MLVALIEDNPSIAQIIMTTLQIHNHRIKHFLDGASFFASLQSTSYDFILADFNLPGTVSGLQVITFLQKNMPTVPMLVISGASESLLNSLRISYPQLSILRKPFHIQTLLHYIETIRKPS